VTETAVRRNAADEALTGLSREEARKRYEGLPLPTTADEHWRFTDLRGFDPESFTATAVPGATGAATLDLDVAGRANVTEAGIEIVSAPEGITFEPLPADFEARIVPEDDKLALHNLASWQHGLLVRVPRGVELEKPLYVQVRSTTDGAALHWRMVVEAEEGARFTLIEDLASTGPDTSAYTNAVVELFVAPNARIEYVSLQNLSRETWHFGRHRARLERDSELDLVLGGFGSKKGKVWVENDLVGRGATSRVTGAYFADGSQHLDYDTFQEHAAPNTESDFAFKGALRETATAVWRGMIRVEPGAQQTNAYQENRNLLLSDKAHADSIPGLEILANDVRCTHGATLGRIDREQLFYLMARGLSRAEAERLIVRGFFQDVLDRIELEPVREALGAALEARIPEA
jgi:Fe-S cluster assembly protein SufD